MHARTHCFAIIALTCSTLSISAHAQCPDTPDNPAKHSASAAFGYATAISADGSVALVSGPGYDSGDGLIRTFERVGDEWIEGAALGALLQFGESFGWSIAMDDAGNRAILTAPRESTFAPEFALASGAAYIYERDEMSGDWSQTQRFEDPTPGTEYNFGASCDISADGNTVVIGRANVLGSDFATLPDAAYVSRFEMGAWGQLVELVPTTTIPDGYNFGERIAISDDASLIAVGAPNAPAFTMESGYVIVFEDMMGTWTQTDAISRPTDGSFNSFGAAVEFDGHTLLTANPAETLMGPAGEEGSPIFLYERSASSYPSAPSEILYQSTASAPAGDLVVRNNSMVVCKYIFSFGGGFGVTRYTRDAEDPSRTWKYDTRFVGELSSDTNTRFGHSVAIANDPDIMIIGEPDWQDTDFSMPGRINFPNRVFTNSDFTVQSGSSSMQIDFNFPGLETQSFFLQLLGFFNLSFPESCSGFPIPSEAVIESFELMPDSPEYILQGPLGSDIRLSEVVISLAAPSDPAPINGEQVGVFTGMTVQVDAMVKIGVLPAFPFSAQGEQSEPMVTQMTGGFFDQPLEFSIPNLELEFEPDLGLGDNNPSVTGTGNVSSTGPAPMICLADLNNDDQLDFIDIQAFIEAYTNLDPLADLNEDFEFDFIDIQAFLASYNSGCP